MINYYVALPILAKTHLALSPSTPTPTTNPDPDPNTYLDFPSV